MDTEDIRKAIRESLQQARTDIDSFAKLEDTLGWRRLKAIAEIQIRNRSQEILNLPELQLQKLGKSADFEKGVIQGITLFLQLPELAMQQAKETLKRNEELKDENSTDESN